MVSTTSGTVTFSMDVDDLIEQALEAIGKEHTSGIEMQKARRILNLVLIQLQNKNIPLSKIATVNQALTTDTASYVLDTSILDVLEVVINKDGRDLPINRYGVKEYHNIPNKLQSISRPNLYKTERLNNAVTITFWPVQDNDDCTAKMLVSKKIEDITAMYQKVDLPTRYLPLLVKLLSYELACTRTGIPDNIKDRLKRDAAELYPDTVDEDRERVDFTIRPGGIGVWGK